MFVEEKAKGEVKELDAASKILLKAADLIEHHGLAKGIRCDDHGSLCVLGAIDKAAGQTKVFDDYATPEWTEAVDRLAKALPGIWKWRSNYHAASWNNADERTADEVIAKLRAVAFSS